MTQDGDALTTAAAVWRIEAAAVTAFLARATGDLQLAEDLAQEAVAAAVEQWPRSGVPPNPGAWLTTVARRRLADHARRRTAERRALLRHGVPDDSGRHEELPMDPEDPFTADPADELRLFFLCCHPSLGSETQVALTLRSVAGLTTEEIARACLIPTATMQQRLVRAKNTLRREEARFDLPPAAELGRRLAAVLAVIYALFTEGHAATSGQDPIRPELCHEALRLARRLTHLAPMVSEVHALAALLELQSSRLGARTDAQGEAVLLEDQDRSQWDHLLIARGLQSLDRARDLAGSAANGYLLQAEIAACHATARRAADTDWTRIAGHHAALCELEPTPARAVARAVAVGRAEGPHAALSMLRPLLDDPRLSRYPYLHAALADAHERAGDLPAARDAYLRTAVLAAGSALERTARAKAGALDGGPPGT